MNRHSNTNVLNLMWTDELDNWDFQHAKDPSKGKLTVRTADHICLRQYHHKSKLRGQVKCHPYPAKEKTINT